MTMTPRPLVTTDTEPSQFTPGPWLIREGSYGRYEAHVSRERGNKMIAGGAIEANARLIAAAPDLLKAAREARGALRMTALFDADDEQSKDQSALQTVRDLLDAAIAKAEGLKS